MLNAVSGTRYSKRIGKRRKFFLTKPSGLFRKFYDRIFLAEKISALILLMVIISPRSQSQNTWVRKADFGGTIRAGAVGFSINNKGYIGTGYDGNFRNDFWEYDPATDAWMQKANFGGAIRDGAVAFSIGSKGYIGTGVGINLTYYHDFWEYDPATNIWTEKSGVGDRARAFGVGFSIGTKGYIGTGTIENDCWEYDSATDTWKRISNFPGASRINAVGFSIGSKGYVGTGRDSAQIFKNDFWEYNPATDTWTEKASYGGSERAYAVGFSIGNKGYIGTGTITNQFWQYDPSSNIWYQKADFAGPFRVGATGFSIGNKGYIGTGSVSIISDYKNDFWEYTACTGNTFYLDADGDGYGKANATILACSTPSGYSANSSDCNDANANVHPNATEVCNNGIDDNCDGQFNENCGSCSVPSNLSAIKITSNSAKLKWNAVAGAESYTVRYKVANASAWTTYSIASISKPINGLLPNTVYKWQVQASCEVDPARVSSWSQKQEFKTLLLRSGNESLIESSLQIFPNPTSEFVTIHFTLVNASNVRIVFCEMSGREIMTVVNNALQSGEHSFQLKTSEFSKGVYLVKMISDFGIENKKLVVE